LARNALDDERRGLEASPSGLRLGTLMMWI
jgi:hypothetical protein